MIRILIGVFVIFMLQGSSAYAEQYDRVIENIISEDGVFDGKNGCVYADIKNIGNYEGVVAISVKDDKIICKFYTNDGVIEFDSLLIECGNRGNTIISIAAMGDGNICFVIDTDDAREVYAYSGSELEVIYNAAVYDEMKIAECNSYGKIIYTNPEELYELADSEREKRITLSRFTDCRNAIPDEKYNRIRNVLQAAADVVSFDAEEYDYKYLMKNILYTSKNYEDVSGIPREYKYEENTEEEDVHSVDAEFVDYVLVNLFGVEPQRDDAKNFTDNGFCYVNGRYYYIGGYTSIFNTKIEDIRAIYDLGKGRYYVIFEDIYNEEDKKIPECGYAVVDTMDAACKIIKLAVGQGILSDNEIKKYSKVAGFAMFSKNNGDPYLFEKEREYIVRVLVAVCVVAISAALIVCIVYISSRRK